MQTPWGRDFECLIHHKLGARCSINICWLSNLLICASLSSTPKHLCPQVLSLDLSSHSAIAIPCNLTVSTIKCEWFPVLYFQTLAPYFHLADRQVSVDSLPPSQTLYVWYRINPVPSQTCFLPYVSYLTMASPSSQSFSLTPWCYPWFLHLLFFHIKLIAKSHPFYTCYTFPTTPSIPGTPDGLKRKHIYFLKYKAEKDSYYFAWQNQYSKWS